MTKREAAIELYRKCAERGLTEAETAVALRRSRYNVHRAAVKNGIAFAKPKPREMTPDKYRACADAGMTRRQTANHLGVSMAAVNRAAYRYCIKFAPARDREADARIRAACVATSGKKSTGAIAKELGVTRAVVLGHRHRARLAGQLP